MKKIKVLIGKPGLDGHEMGARLIARCLRDAGMEVVYTGMRQTPDMIVTTAIQEDVDVIGLSFLSGSHKELCAEITRKMKAKKLDNMVLVVGGIIPAKDWDYLKSLGVDAVFGPGSNTDVITKTVTDLAKTKKGAVTAG